MALAVAAGLYLVLAGAIFFLQGSLIFPAPPRGRPPAFADHLLEAGSARYLWFAPPAPDAPVVVQFHGNGEDLADIGPDLDLAREAGCGVAAVEFPGYGVAPGTPGEAAIYEAAEAVVRKLNVPQERLVLMGRSLGSGVAVELARRGHGARVALISPYTSIAALGQGLYPWLPVSLMTRHRFDSLSKAPAVKVPVLVVHGTDDEVVPFWMGERLARAFPNGQLDRVVGGHHNDLYAAFGPGMRAALQPFLRGR